MTMQRVLRLVVVAGLAMCLPTAVHGSMEGVSCSSDGRTIETTGCVTFITEEGFSGISAASNFLNTYVKIHSGDTSKPFSCADGLIYVDSSKRYSAITTLGVTNLRSQRDGQSTDDLYYLKSNSNNCADVVAALKALSHDTTAAPKTTTAKKTTNPNAKTTSTTSATTTTTPTTTTATPTTTTTTLEEGNDDGTPPVGGATDFSGLRVDCASGTCSLVDVCDNDLASHSETTWQLQNLFPNTAFRCKRGKIYYADATATFPTYLKRLDDRAKDIGCAPFTQKDNIGFDVSAGDDPGRLIFPAEFENNAAACQTIRNNLVSVLTSYATGAGDNSGCKVAVTSSTTTRRTTARAKTATTTTTTAAAALTPSLDAMMCDAQKISNGYLQAASCNTQGASDETQFFNEFLKRSGMAEQPFKCLTKATIKKMKLFSAYKPELENDIYVDIGGDTIDAANGPGICADLISPIKTAALALCDADPSCAQSHVNEWMSCYHLHSDMYRITTQYNNGCNDMKKELQLLSLPGTSTSTTTTAATAPAPTTASTTASSTTPNSNTDASTTAEIDDGSSTLSPPSATTATATANPATSPESTALAPATTPQPAVAGSSKGSGGGTAVPVLGVLLLLAVVACAAVWHCTRKQAEYQHGQVDAVQNPAYIVDIDEANPRRNSVVATDSNQRQFLVPMEADNTGDGDGDGDGDADADGGDGAGAGGSAPPSPEYLVAVTYNDDYTYGPPIPPPTERQGMPSNAAAAADGANASGMPATDADGYVVDEYTAKDGGGLVADVHVEKDADGYVVDDFTPDGGGDPIVYATYDAGAGAADNGGAVYSVPASESGAIEAYAPAVAGVESNA